MTARGKPASGALYARVRIALTDHFLRRLEERGGRMARLAVEGGDLVVSGWLRAIHERDYSLTVPRFGQLRVRVDRAGRGFVAVMYLPLRAG